MIKFNFSINHDKRSGQLLGRYYIKDYNERFVKRMKSLARHIYSVEENDGKRYVYDFEHNPIPKKVIITDKRLGLTSSYDRMSWEIFVNSGFTEDKTIVL